MRCKKHHPATLLKPERPHFRRPPTPVMRNATCKGTDEPHTAMSISSTPAFDRESEEFEPDPSQNGPAPHEDLTIGELLESMRVKGEQRPGEQCFINEKHEHCWFPDSEVDRFIAEYGAEHPSTYRQRHGGDWRDDFFQHVLK
jgi:hypothetical protein